MSPIHPKNLSQTGRGTLSLILWGIRSGQSRFSPKATETVAGRCVLFAATADARDGEMTRSPRLDQQPRAGAWRTLEFSDRVAESASAKGRLLQIVIADCLPLLTDSNRTFLMAAGRIPDRKQRATDATRVAPQIEPCTGGSK